MTVNRYFLNSNKENKVSNNNIKTDNDNGNTNNNININNNTKCLEFCI